MAPILTIATILDQLLAGECTREQAVVWIDLRIGEAVTAACDRDGIAARAMQTLMGDRKFVQEARNNNLDSREVIAVEAYAQADAMKNARN
jgi:hypothetical protein